MEVGLALGSNVGDRLAHLSQAGRLILELPGISFAARSPVYETEPVGVPKRFAGQAFLNSVLIVNFALPADNLIGLFRSVEVEMGRTPAPANAPRIIDIDVIYAGSLQRAAEDGVIPHPRWFNRRFVVQPLSDVRPELHIPGQRGTVSDVLKRLSDRSAVVCFADNW